MGLFNRPTASVIPGEGEPADIFSHSQSHSEILAEQERRRRERVDKRVKKEGKRKSDEGFEASPRKGEGESPKKKKKSRETPTRRRISGQDIDGLLREVGVTRIFGDESEDEHVAVEGSSKRSSPRKGAVGSRSTRSSSKANGTSHAEQPEVVDVGESSGDEVHIDETRCSNPALPVEEDDESDEELAALARQRRLERTHSSSNFLTKSATPQAGSPHTGPETPYLPDPVVEVLIVSRLPQTKQLMVYRKLSQNLREIRLAWCKRQGFDDAFTNGVFLIYRMRRVYDMTTCASLGLETDADGNVTMKGAEGKEGAHQVALEAVTDDIFQMLLTDRAKEEAKRRGQWEGGVEDDAEDEATPSLPPQEELIGLVLKAKGKSDFKLKVKPTTPFSKIINACRKTFHVAEGSTVTLDFDGDRLEPQDLVNSTDIDDLDVIDVHIS